MIINTGSRTDIPAFYSTWFLRRLEAGYVDVRNPYAPQIIQRYRLDPEVVDALVFCTKNPTPMLDHLHALDAFRQYWHVTITPYGKEIEKNLPNKNRIIDSFQRLSRHVGTKAVVWRYDPILINDKYTVAYHIHIFEEMCKRLSGYTSRCIISFIDLYAKTIRNFPEVTEVTRADQETIAEAFAAIGRRYGIAIATCLEGAYLQDFGIDTQGCMTQSVIEDALDIVLELPKLPAAREGCTCLLGNDIGAYNTCLHGCRYCYANYDEESVRRNYQLHDDASSLLIGHLREDDTIREMKQTSYISRQLSIQDFL